MNRSNRFRPTFDIEGPHRPRQRFAQLVLPTTREGWGRVVMTACGIAGLFFIVGAIARHLGAI